MKNYTAAITFTVVLLIGSFSSSSAQNQLGAVGTPFLKTIEAPGTFEFSTVFSLSDFNLYDPERTFTSSIINPYDDENPNRKPKKYFVYDSKGNMIRAEDDYNGNDTLDNIRVFTYDANGNLTRQEDDRDADGIADEITTYTYNTDGNPTREEFDYNVDGKLDRIFTYTYDANGYLTRREDDRDADSTAEDITTYTNDANGNLTREEYDRDADGTTERITTYTYDANGNLTRQEDDRDADGTAERITTYTYDANGNLTVVESDSDGDGTADESFTYVYDANGRITGAELDTDGDGVIEETVTVSYDITGNMLGFQNYRGDTLTRSSSYSYDINNNRVRIENDENGNDTLDGMSTYSFFNPISCPNLGDGLAHKLEVIIPESGFWRFSMCESGFQNVLALSSTQNCDSNLFYASDGCSNGNALAEIELDSGTYYLTVVGKGSTDKGDYTLEINRLQGSNIALIKNELISIYPNPAQDMITISHSNVAIDSYVILNALGQPVLGGLLESHSVNIGTLPSGGYIIQLTDSVSNQTYHKKFMK
ncbi:T9SS type A sorting domain-containing protein [Bacteroidia bacterium]|nr:T9SS type A sorting domain-containing protein [Bacteroidia bacterium]